MTKEQVQRHLVINYLTSNYGEDMFLPTDFETMQIDKEGTVYLSYTQIKTGIKL